jgi:hypothetical protein
MRIAALAVRRSVALLRQASCSKSSLCTYPRVLPRLRCINAIHLFLDRVCGFENEVRDCNVCLEQYYDTKIVESICARCAREVCFPVPLMFVHLSVSLVCRKMVTASAKLTCRPQ